MKPVFASWLGFAAWFGLGGRWVKHSRLGARLLGDTQLCRSASPSRRRVAKESLRANGMVAKITQMHRKIWLIEGKYAQNQNTKPQARQHDNNAAEQDRSR